MKLVLAIDSFKGSASSKALNQASLAAIKKVMPLAWVETFTIADGGEGTLDALNDHLDGQLVSVQTVDLMGQKIQADYLLVDQTAIIESAKVIGLDKISPSPETFAKASSYGLGALVKDAVSRGCKEILIGLGGTGTSDGGFGFLKSLGFNPETCQLESDIDFSQLTLIGLADVTNPYYGPNGFAPIFGPQKGGNQEEIAAMDSIACAFANRIKEQRGMDLQSIAGAGAAGGLGAAIAVLGGQIKPGFETIAQMIRLEESIMRTDLVITGEGKLDGQSQAGKVPVAISRLAKSFNKPTIAICGVIEDSPELDQLFTATFSIQREFLDLNQAMSTEKTLSNLERTMTNIMKARYWRE
ncbi:glycerate kinase family protein [Streptococcus hongkongensis]|nr:glycerate kinase [Streptococcus uberis]